MKLSKIFGKRILRWLKRCFDEFKQEFERLAKLLQLESTQKEILQLSAQIAELQKHLNKSSNVILESQEEIDIDDGEQENYLTIVEEDEEASQGKIVSAEKTLTLKGGATNTKPTWVGFYSKFFNIFFLLAQTW